ncbi:MerR family DNA-binding transcriptional regulator, partial [bacterium]|nr:MerR family DNA-binding transcriptional regulator [bacterium]
MAKLAGVLPSTIRYYTELGLLEVAATTPGG